MTDPARSMPRRWLAFALLALSAGALLSGCYWGVRRGRCWHEAFRDRLGEFHPGHWGRCN
jgi:hypothetical protein